MIMFRCKENTEVTHASDKLGERLRFLVPLSPAPAMGNSNSTSYGVLLASPSSFIIAAFTISVSFPYFRTLLIDRLDAA